MSDVLRVIGVVPARSGSRGIIGKNIRPFLGKPLLAWAIESGVKSEVLDKIIILTDSVEYAEIAKKYGAEAPWLEPKNLAGNSVHVFESLKWLLLKLQETGSMPEYVVLLEPTAPARQASHIRNLVKLVKDSGSDSGFTAMRVQGNQHAYWQFSLDDEFSPNLVTGVPFKNIIRRKQELPPLFIRGGSTYVAKSELLLKDQPDMYGDKIKVLEVDSKYQVDIDTEEDWINAEKNVKDFIEND